MRLDTVEKLTTDRDLVKRHSAFLSSECERLQAKTELSADEQLRLKEIEIRLSDCKLYLAETERELQQAVPEPAKRIRQLGNEKFSLILFEKYVLLKRLRDISETLGLSPSATYNMHTAARDEYNKLFDIPPYKDPRGRKKCSD